MSDIIPAGWSLNSLKNSCEGLRGVSYKPSDLHFSQNGQTVTLLRSNNIQEAGLCLNDVQHVDHTKVKKAQVAQPGDIAVCMSNGSKRLVGKSSSFKNIPLSGKYTVGAFCSIFRPHPNADKKFIEQLFKSDAFQHQVDFSLAGSAINNLKNSDLEEYKFLFPPLPEQKKIAAILTSVDEVIEATQAQINKLKDLKTGMMQELLTKGIGHTEFKDSPVGRIPVGWEVVPLSEISTKIGDGIHATPQYTTNSDYYFINGNNLREGRIVINDDTKHIPLGEFQKHKKDLTNHTILMSINGTIGNLAFYHGEKVILGKSASFISLNDGISKNFIYYTLESERVKKFYILELTGSTIMNLSLRSIRSTPILLPPLEEQIEIATLLDTCDRNIKSKHIKLTQLQQLKKALMQDLLTGRVRVNVDHEMEEVVVN